jgi:hypothetical protein
MIRTILKYIGASITTLVMLVIIWGTLTAISMAEVETGDVPREVSSTAGEFDPSRPRRFPPTGDV